MARSWKSYLALFALVGGGFAAGLALGYRIFACPPGTRQHSHTHMAGYRFTSPLLDCEIVADRTAGSELQPFRYKVSELIARRTEAGDADHVAMYFRHLESGASFNIDAQEKFIPASLLKIPVMIAWLKRAERDQTVLGRTFRYDGATDWSAPQAIKPRKTLTPHASYTVDDLIFRMIAYSDNNAWRLLLDNIDTRELDAIVADLNVDFDPSQAATDSMSVKAYSSFYRVLYNATYLNREMSEKALRYLSSVDFRDGILGGVPAGVTVASKFGEKTLEESGIRELHEFGIVYHPRGAYLLGIMTKGHDFARLASVIREISRVVYSEVSSQRVMRAE
ncbi:serine hydrolase [Geobacter hydrogenophilus]|uniref:serine hydrolase n=1 Tax=Geobacter hydrogenophilus TaxID=40983 RepID=UPI001BD97197|nr:serine hydrolase [Geobacter hydrogenophilus]MBT0894104.1 serine hydrolase [Geobacter hydrogenophilus]